MQGKNGPKKTTKFEAGPRFSRGRHRCERARSHRLRCSLTTMPPTGENIIRTRGRGRSTSMYSSTGDPLIDNRCTITTKREP